jgi:RNA polymerase sigma-70 factor, ECF subfamily
LIQVAAYPAREPAPETAEIDADTLAACRAGDPEAMTAFVRRYERSVFAFLSRALGHGPHVEDLAQEVFLRALRALARFDAAGSARASTWLLTIASRLVIDERRKRRVPTEPLDEGLAAQTTTTPETEQRRGEVGRALSRAAGELPDDQRDVFLLTEFHGLDASDIASMLSIPKATVKTRLFRAREHLRVLLKGILEET